MGARDAARNESTRLRALRGTAACRGQGSLLRGGQLDRGTLAFPRGVSRSVSELQRYMDEMGKRGNQRDGRRTDALASACLSAGASPLRARNQVHAPDDLGLLPPTIRADYGFPWSARHEAMLRLLAALVRTLLPLTPPILRYWPAARAAARAASGSGCPLRRCTVAAIVVSQNGAGPSDQP